MGRQRTKTIKNKHAANKSGISASKASSRRPQADGVINSKKPPGRKKPLTTQVKGRPVISELLKKKKKREYTEKELGIPKLNSIVPAGVQKPKGKKKGKVFVDDLESMGTILALVQAEKEGQIESKMMKARQLEELREARKAEAEKKEAERQAKLDDTKNSLRKKRKRNHMEESDKGEVKAIATAGSKAVVSKKKKVAFAE
ncbi:hypothetical protein P8C59_006902 [Phyllachora maydis]|uniref:60S ribosomal subunit assembly/export protein LOC1 n=1 Tax=Phyllachora maydis TaxID=1825666 RepID=A0AAD9MF00_9PEZI|nr:hypothetical protein P8C59_006902 [Phyllachora maydis]